MDLQSWIEKFNGFASLYSFDILHDGTYSELRLMALNSNYSGLLTRNPAAPKFYPGIPYRNYFTDINFESFCYKCAADNEPLYSYVNAHGYWLQGFYMPVSFPDDDTTEKELGAKTVYCLYILKHSTEMNSDSMSQRSSDVSNAVLNISIKLHESQDYYQSMADTVREIKKICGSDRCSLLTFDKANHKCELINEDGVQSASLDVLSSEMERMPYEIAEAWEKDLAGSDCLLLDDLRVMKDRDPVWYKSLAEHDVRSIILYAIRFNRMLVGFIWAAGFNTSRMMKIKEILELATFLVGAVIANHQMFSSLEEMSKIDNLTQVSSRNAMNIRVDMLVAGETEHPQSMGVIFADLNGLKTVNDENGHETGDKLLAKAASLLKISFGEYEIYRAGGDEFVIFCPNISEGQFEKLIARHRTLMENTPEISFAMGCGFFTGEYDICRAMQIADERMYKDKEDYYRRHPEKDRRKKSRS